MEVILPEIPRLFGGLDFPYRPAEQDAGTELAGEPRQQVLGDGPDSADDPVPLNPEQHEPVEGPPVEGGSTQLGDEFAGCDVCQPPDDGPGDSDLEMAGVPAGEVGTLPHDPDQRLIGVIHPSPMQNLRYLLFVEEVGKAGLDPPDRLRSRFLPELLWDFVQRPQPVGFDRRVG